MIKTGIRQPIPGHISRIMGTELEFRSVRVSLFRLNLFHGLALSAFAADNGGRNKSFLAFQFSRFSVLGVNDNVSYHRSLQSRVW